MCVNIYIDITFYYERNRMLLKTNKNPNNK